MISNKEEMKMTSAKARWVSTITEWARQKNQIKNIRKKKIKIKMDITGKTKTCVSNLRSNPCALIYLDNLLQELQCVIHK